MKRAAGLLRDATRDLAAMLDGVDPVAEVTVTPGRPIGDVVALVEWAIAEYGTVDVTIIRRP